eukprot:GEMP01015535.1.p1 GENE.GEMP01015535.1~~GEMP01015535.1.p1  ORF type:complete len:300 (+),score=78.97 GEMP01015535.1:108-1007(+)
MCRSGCFKRKPRKRKGRPSTRDAATSPIASLVASFHAEAPIIHGLTEDNAHIYQDTLQMLADAPQWDVAYESTNPPGKLLYKMEPGNTTSGWLYMAAVMPCPLVGILAPRLEVDTWPQWNPYCTKHEWAGDCSAWQFQTHFEQSMAMGAFKSDQNTRTVQWVNETEGFFLQRVTTLNPGDMGYVTPRLNRNQMEAAILTMSPSPNETMIVQLISVDLPISLPQFIQKFVASTMAPKLLKQMTTNASHVPDPKYPYKQRIDEDKLGLYAHLHKLALWDSPKPTSIIQSTNSLLRGDAAQV